VDVQNKRVWLIKGMKVNTGQHESSLKHVNEIGLFRKEGFGRMLCRIQGKRL